MNRHYFVIFTMGLLVIGGIVWAQNQAAAPQAADNTAAPAGQLASVVDKVSYGIGMNIGQQLLADGYEVNPDALALGIKDVFARNQPRISEQDLRNAFQVVQQQQMERQAQMQQEQAVLGQKNAQIAQAFLESNGKKEGVTTTASGLQYQVITAGTGPMPKASDTVRTHYRGTLLDGTQFDSSYDRGQPATFPVDGVIAGWTEALQLMKVGSKWKLFVPADLAYGNNPPGEPIQPGSLLIFEVELLAIE